MYFISFLHRLQGRRSCFLFTLLTLSSWWNFASKNILLTHSALVCLWLIGSWGLNPFRVFHIALHLATPPRYNHKSVLSGLQICSAQTNSVQVSYIHIDWFTVLFVSSCFSFYLVWFFPSPEVIESKALDNVIYLIAHAVNHSVICKSSSFVLS